jgi:hypothetical protein
MYSHYSEFICTYLAAYQVNCQILLFLDENLSEEKKERLFSYYFLRRVVQSSLGIQIKPRSTRDTQSIFLEIFFI